jgi:copper homeostasis protein
MSLLLEVIACSVRDAIEAERGGAGRLEIVRELDRGGLTPAAWLVRAVRDAVSLPVRVMLREHDGYGSGEAADVERLTRCAGQMTALGVNGLVLGFLRKGAIDIEAMDAIVAAAPGVPVTFHHAFDELPDARATVEALKRWPGIDRVLSAGGTGDWRERARRLGELAGQVAPCTVLPGGGVDAGALRLLVRTPGLTEAHVGRAARVPSAPAGSVDRRAVAALVEAAT